MAKGNYTWSSRRRETRISEAETMNDEQGTRKPMNDSSSCELFSGHPSYFPHGFSQDAANGADEDVTGEGQGRLQHCSTEGAHDLFHGAARSPCEGQERHLDD